MRAGRRLALFALAVLAGAPAGAEPLPRQVDLDCAGTAQFAGVTPRAFHAVYHLDLGANRFCADACEGLSRIAGVTPALITLTDRTDRDAFNTNRATATYDPEAHQYRYRYVASGGIPFTWLVDAQCEVRPFTPFPATAAMRESE